MSLAQKIPFARSLNRIAQNRALDEIAKRGQSLPGRVTAVTGAIVTVAFDIEPATLSKVTMPLAGSEYSRLPIQVGDKGYAAAADAYLGGVSGLGGGTADLSLRGNLSTLVWVPLGNKDWPVPPGSDGNTHVLYGKNALLLLDSIAGNSSIKLTSTSISLDCGGHNITIDSSGVHIDGRIFLAHEHSGVQTGLGNTGAVV